MTTETLPETMYLLMRVVRWETAAMVTNMDDPVAVRRPDDAPDCVGFCLVFASKEAAIEAADEGETIQPVRRIDQ